MGDERKSSAAPPAVEVRASGVASPGDRNPLVTTRGWAFSVPAHRVLADVVSDRHPARGPVRLRSAAEHDLPRVADLTTAFYEEDGFVISPRATMDARLRTFLRQSDANVTVAVTSDATVGFALTTMRLILESGLVAELQDLYVAPEYRGMGIGSALVADAAQWARDNSAATLEVVIAPNGRDVTHLDRYYASLGFVEEGRRLVHLDL